MGYMTDAVDPSHIPAALDGSPALRITVLADTAGEAFDAETGNAGNGPVAAAIRARLASGRWSVAYTNQDNYGPLSAALSAAGVAWSDASRWPAPGCYLWAADPSGNIAAGVWRPSATPIAVQDQYPGPVDISTTYPTFPAKVAGYIDGAASVWPAAAWSRFTTIDTPAPYPVPRPTRRRPQAVYVFVATDTFHAWFVYGSENEAGGLARRWITNPQSLASFQSSYPTMTGTESTHADVAVHGVHP